MIIAVAATEMELRALAANAPEGLDLELVLGGVGPVETAHVLTRFLAGSGSRVSAVLNFGVAGAYVYPDGSGAGLLDICLASEERLGDLGLCHQDRIEPLNSPELGVRDRFPMDAQLRRRAAAFLDRRGMNCRQGPFVTVSCASASRRRAALLTRDDHPLCENMEGAAVALVCEGFGLPCVELRCVSNLVEDRNQGNWRLKEACRKAGRAAALLAAHLEKTRP